MLHTRPQVLGNGVEDGLTLGNSVYDFAGSSIVHAFGGFGALACVLVLGPRKGKYSENGLNLFLQAAFL